MDERKRLEEALINADRAGDKDAATALSQAIRVFDSHPRAARTISAPHLREPSKAGRKI